MSSTALHAIAIITPTPGKEDRLKWVLMDLAQKVKENESGVFSYQIFEELGSEGARVFVLEESYKDEAAFNAHFQTEYFKAAGKAFDDESLVSGPLEIKKLATLGGFQSR